MASTTRFKKKKHARKNNGGIRKHKFAACAKKCHGNRSCMSACLKG